MTGRTKFAMILTGLAIAIPQSAIAAAPNAKLWNGTWHLNAAKSKFSSSAKEQSETRTYDVSASKVMVKSSLIRLPPVVFSPISRQRHKRQAGPGRVFSELSGHLVAVHPGQADV